MLLSLSPTLLVIILTIQMENVSVYGFSALFHGAVVSTFVYLATIDEVFKRAIHTAVAILTALMAATKATR